MKKISIDGVIGTGDGEVSAAFVKSQLPPNGLDPIEVSIHSEGGSVFEGFAIYDALKAYAGPKKCLVASSAFSIASYIPMAFDDVEITPNGYMMLHSPYAQFEGNAEDFAIKSELLSQLKTNMIQAYASKTGRSPQDIQAILNNETYYNAAQAVAVGLANRITPTPIMGRVFAKLNRMPHGVVAALFGADSIGDNSETTRSKTMSDATPVPATVQEIKRMFPKAKSDFIIKCLEQQMPMQQVAATAVQDTMTENDTLLARVAALEQQVASMQAEETAEPVVAPTAAAPVEQPVALARSGVKPIAKSKAAATVSAKSQWDTCITAKVNSGMPKAKAVGQVNKENPGLREQMLSEVNS